MIKIVCVLKDQADSPYNGIYVDKLYNTIDNNLKLPYEFVCLTNSPKQISSGITIKPLLHGLEGWWSKMEIFRPDLFRDCDGVLYFDLDTLIMDDINELAELAADDFHSFMTLRGFNKARKRKGDPVASGIMIMNSFSSEANKVYNHFMKDPKGNIARQKAQIPGEPRKGAGERGDQGFIAKVLGEKNVPKLQDYLPDKYIMGKRHVRNHKELPQEPHVVAWSGKPRLHNAKEIGRASCRERVYTKV